MPTNVTAFTSDETPTTRRVENLRSPVLTALAQIDRLAELSIERLLIHPDNEALDLCVAELSRIRSLVEGVMR